MSREFTTIIPPPNLTGKLHIGHGLCLSVIDFLSRSNRVIGNKVTVLPGYDHGGISTENSANKYFKFNNNINIEEKFKKIYDFANNFKENIKNQIEKFHMLIDWDKCKYTFDNEHCKLVENTFINLYEKGLIYRDFGLVNYDTKLKTSISDLEVDYEEIDGYLYYIPYEVHNEKIIVATTRPETMLGDTALCVNPNDTRYSRFIGKQAKVPFVNRLIPILADKSVDMDYGTGVLKITPAHDLNDYELYKKYKLDILNIFDRDHKIYLPDHEFHGLTIEELMDKISPIFIKKEPIKHMVPYSSKTNTVVEIMLLKQWFLKQKHIAKDIIDNNTLNFVPNTWKGSYESWFKNLRDWCLSRNITWGHRIPAWHNGDQIKVAKNCPGENWIQTNEVLDTWFSSALWAITYDKSFNIFPTTVLVTGYDIIFFWVARMVIMSHLLNYPLPFKHVFIHQLVRDAQGLKMSKTRGNVQDPMEICDKYSCDLFKFTMMRLVKPKGNILFSTKQIENSQKIVTKLENLHLFIKKYNYEVENRYENIHKYFELYINNKVNEFINNINNYDTHKIIDSNYETLYFICDWLVEFAKRDSYLLKTLKYVYEKILLLFYSSIPDTTTRLYKDMFQDNIENNILKITNGDNNNCDEIDDLIANIKIIRSLQNYGIKLLIYDKNSYVNIIKFLCKCQSTKVYNYTINSIKIEIEDIQIENLKEKQRKLLTDIEVIKNFLNKTNHKTPENIINEKKNSLKNLYILQENLGSILLNSSKF